MKNSATSAQEKNERTKYFASKMSTKTFVVFAIVSYVFFPISKIVGQSVNANTSILTAITNDQEVCKTKSVFSESRYVKSCQEVPFLVDQNETLDESKNGKFLCLGLYQKIKNICFLDSLPKATNKIVPHTSSLFDARVEKSYFNNSMDVVTFCKNWKFPNMSEYPKIKHYVAQLNNVLNKPVPCLKMCSTYQGQVEPICAVLATIDGISLELKAVTKQSAGEGPEENSKNTEAKSSPVTNPVQSKLEPTDRKAQNETIKASQSVTNAVDAALKKIPKNMKPKEQTEATSEKKTESRKPETAQTAEMQKQKEPKGTSMEEEKEDKAPQAILHTVTDQKKDKTDTEPVAAKNSNDNPPGAGEGQVVAHANSQEDIGKNPTAIEQEEGDTDVISQHTQDDDITLYRRPSEDVNEIESPIMPTLEEDVNENPVHAPEKSSFVPHLPGLREDDDSHFFGYFTVIGVICLAGYVGYHNKQKIFAMVLEGRRSRGGRGKRRPSTANYRKLDCTLEEAVTSQCNSNVTHVIY